MEDQKLRLARRIKGPKLVVPPKYTRMDENPNGQRYWKQRVEIMEMHFGLMMTPAQIAGKLNMDRISISSVLTKHFYYKPDNPGILVLQSKINE